MIKKDDLLVLSRKDELALKSPSNLAFMPYFFVQTNFPYTEVEGREFVRKNGNLTLSLYSPKVFRMDLSLALSLLLLLRKQSGRRQEKFI